MQNNIEKWDKENARIVLDVHPLLKSHLEDVAHYYRIPLKQLFIDMIDAWFVANGHPSVDDIIAKSKTAKPRRKK